MVTHTERREVVEVVKNDGVCFILAKVSVIEDWIGESPNGFERRRCWFVDLMRMPGLAFSPEIKEQIYVQRLVDERRMCRQGQVNLS